MRYLPLPLLLMLGATWAGEPQYPLWDGSESVADYAKRVNLPPTKTLDLGGGVNMELVLIPAGKFVMGTPEPVAVDEVGFHKRILIGQVLLSVGSGLLMVLVGAVIVQAIRKRQRPKFSLAKLLAMTAAAGIAVLSGVHWQQSVRGLEKARVEHQMEEGRFDAAKPEEKPAHPVTLTQPFYMAKFAVTQEQYQAVIGANPSHFMGKNNPVEQVSWYDGQAFCNNLTEQTKQTVRLPTEAEWEFACRAGTSTVYYSGDTDKDLDRVAWYDANSKGKTHPVGQKQPNAFGLYDMHGNVWQWCQDLWEEDYSKSSSENPQGPAQGEFRLLRGGSWFNYPMVCRSAYRWFDPGNRISFIGFRVVSPASTQP